MIQVKYGLDWNNDTIGIHKAKPATALKAGSVVALVNGYLEASTSSWLLLQEVDLYGPTFEQRVLGILNYNIKAGNPVTVAIMKRGMIIETDNISGSSIAKDDKFNIIAGVFTKDTNGTAAVCTKVIDAAAGIYELTLN